MRCSLSRGWWCFCTGRARDWVTGRCVVACYVTRGDQAPRRPGDVHRVRAVHTECVTRCINEHGYWVRPVHAPSCLTPVAPIDPHRDAHSTWLVFSKRIFTQGNGTWRVELCKNTTHDVSSVTPYLLIWAGGQGTTRLVTHPVTRLPREQHLTGMWGRL